MRSAAATPRTTTAIDAPHESATVNSCEKLAGGGEDAVGAVLQQSRIQKVGEVVVDGLKRRFAAV